MKRETSQMSNELNCRIATNTTFGNNDLTSWLLKKMKLKENETLLDVGCGTGAQLFSFAKKIKTDFSCTGIDISEDSINKCKDYAKNNNIKINLQQLNFDNLEDLHNKKKFDTITSIYAAYYSSNIKIMLNKLKNYLNKNGRIIIMGPYDDNNKKWFEFIFQFMQLQENVIKSTTTFMYDEILPFACNNFKSVICHRFENKLTIPNLEALRNYWKSNIYYKEDLDNQFEKFANEHFSKFSEFSYKKVALYVEMKNPIF